jgi:CheY-like chemotaxis protein
MRNTPRYCVLFADDDLESATRVADRLPADYVCECARSMDEALAILESRRIDVAVIDVMLPDTRLTLSPHDTTATLLKKEDQVRQEVVEGPGLNLYQHIKERYAYIRCAIYSKLPPVRVYNWRSDLHIDCPVLSKPPNGTIDQLLTVIRG